MNIKTMKLRIIILVFSLISLGVHAQGFCQQEITDSIFVRIEGKSFKENCTTPRRDLRYLKVLHYNKEGEELEGELICHKDIVDDLLAIFREFPLGFQRLFLLLSEICHILENSFHVFCLLFCYHPISVHWSSFWIDRIYENTF